MSVASPSIQLGLEENWRQFALLVLNLCFGAGYGVVRAPEQLSQFNQVDRGMDTISPDMNVADVVERHPQTVEVFLNYGCPDMRKGFFALMARMMSVRSAARIHRLPLDRLVEDLNASVNEKAGG